MKSNFLNKSKKQSYRHYFLTSIVLMHIVMIRNAYLNDATWFWFLLVSLPLAWMILKRKPYKKISPE